jgi:hypothetical protein
MGMLKYRIVDFSTGNGTHIGPTIFVDEPFNVLGDLSNIPDTAFPKIIAQIYGSSQVRRTAQNSGGTGPIVMRKKR